MGQRGLLVLLAAIAGCAVSPALAADTLKIASPIRGQTIRVQITNAQNLAARKDAFARYMKAYNETVDWMYSSPEAVPRYIAFSGLSEPAVRLMLKDFIPKESLQTATISGLDESMKDAVQFKFLSAPLNGGQLKELIQIVPGS